MARLASVGRVRIDKGITELSSGVKEGNVEKKQKTRKEGGGRKQHRESQAGLLESLEAMVNPHTRGGPMKVLLWTSRSLRDMEKGLREKGYKVSYVTVGGLLKSLGYSLQANKKANEGGDSPDRNAQFEYINETALSFISDQSPVISVDCKKKELIGNFKNTGTDWFLRGEAPNVNVYDFIDKELGKAVPYGVYDMAQNKGWASVGISKDTAGFAVNTIRTWWQHMGKCQYPGAKKILITADGGAATDHGTGYGKKSYRHLPKRPEWK